MSTVEIPTKKQPLKPITLNTQAHSHHAPACGATRPTHHIIPRTSSIIYDEDSLTEEEVHENGYFTPNEDEDEEGEGGGDEKTKNGQKSDLADWTEYMYSSKSWADMVEEEEIENQLKNVNSQSSAVSNEINEINDSKNSQKSMKNDNSTDSIESMRRPHYSGSSSSVSSSSYYQRNRTNGYFGRSQDASANNTSRPSTGHYNGQTSSSGYRSGAFSTYNGQNRGNSNNSNRGNISGSGGTSYGGNRLNSSCTFRNNGYHHNSSGNNGTNSSPLSPRSSFRENANYNGNAGPKSHFRSGSNGRINPDDKENFNCEDKENIKNMKPIKKRKYGTKFPKNGRETEPHRIEQRQKQINFGKNTEGYKNYIELVPKHLRQKTHPQTPNPYALCSKRNWDRQVRTWRRSLHLWDSEPSNKDNEDKESDNEENENDEIDESEDDYTPLKSDMPALDDIPLSDQEILVSLKI